MWVSLLVCMQKGPGGKILVAHSYQHWYYFFYISEKWFNSITVCGYKAMLCSNVEKTELSASLGDGLSCFQNRKKDPVPGGLGSFAVLVFDWDGQAYLFLFDSISERKEQGGPPAGPVLNPAHQKRIFRQHNISQNKEKMHTWFGTKK